MTTCNVFRLFDDLSAISDGVELLVTCTDGMYLLLTYCDGVYLLVTSSDDVKVQ